MTKKQAIKLLQSAKLPADLDKLRDYVLKFTIDRREISEDKFRDIIETISDYNYTIALLGWECIAPEFDGSDVYTYAVDIVDNTYYPEYYN